MSISKTYGLSCMRMHGRFTVFFSPGNLFISVRRSKYLLLQLDRQAIACESNQGSDFVV